MNCGLSFYLIWSSVALFGGLCLWVIIYAVLETARLERYLEEKSRIA
jgi:hypothetical protein